MNVTSKRLELRLAHLAELADYLDLDGNLLITNDPCRGVTIQKGLHSFADAGEIQIADQREKITLRLAADRPMKC